MFRSEDLANLRRLLNEYHGWALRAPNQDLSSAEMKIVARVKYAIIKSLTILQASKKIKDDLRIKILALMKLDITQASTAAKIEAIIKEL